MQIFRFLTNSFRSWVIFLLSFMSRLTFSDADLSFLINAWGRDVLLLCILFTTFLYTCFSTWSYQIFVYFHVFRAFSFFILFWNYFQACITSAFMIAFLLRQPLRVGLLFNRSAVYVYSFLLHLASSSSILLHLASSGFFWLHLPSSFITFYSEESLDA